MCATFNGGSGDVFPGDSYGVTAAGGFDSMRFGFDFGRSKLTVNARAETAPTTFRYAFSKGRCVVRVNGFYEWTRDKRKFYYTKDGGLLLCGLWREEKEKPASRQLDIFGLVGEASEKQTAPRKSFVIVTTAANDSVFDVHGRMPLIVNSARADEWLYDEKFAGAHLRATMPMLDSAPCAVN